MDKMDIEKRIIVKAIRTKQNELIPIWDKRLTFVKNNEEGHSILLEGSFETFYQLVECVYNLKTKQIEQGVELHIYPNENELQFKVGETVLYEKSYRVLDDVFISEIVYEEFDLEVTTGKNLEKDIIENFKEIEFDNKTLYLIKRWKPYYILHDDTRVTHTYKLYRKGAKLIVFDI